MFCVLCSAVAFCVLCDVSVACCGVLDLVCLLFGVLFCARCGLLYVGGLLNVVYCSVCAVCCALRAVCWLVFAAC